MGRRSSRFGSSIKSYIPLGPGLAWISIFLLAPLGLLTLISFFSFNPTSIAGYEPVLTLDNYIRLVTVPVYSQVLLATVQLALTVTALCLALGYPIGYLMGTKIKNETLRFVILLFLLIPFWIDWSIRSMAWYPILGEQGLLRYALDTMGLSHLIRGTILLSPFSVILVMVQTYTLFMITPIYLALIKMDPVLLQAAETLGANRRQSFYHITFRMSLPGIVVGCIFVLTFSIADYATPRLLGGVVQTIGVAIVSQINVLNWPLAAAYSTITIGTTMALIYILLKVVDIKRMVF